LLKENNDYLALQILEMEIERDPPDEVTQRLFDSQAAAKITYPYDELFADVMGLSEFKENQISNILHKRITDSFAKKIPVKEWKDNEEHRYFDPVRSWLWDRVLARNLTKNERDQLTEKIFKVSQTELQDIFTNQSLYKKFLEDQSSIEYFNQRLIDRLIQAGF
jgi:hypothetical protein